MVLDSVFLPADRTLWAPPSHWITGPAYEALREYHCENVSLSELKMRLKRVSGGTVLVEVRASLSARRGHDKEVTVRLDVRNGEERVAEAVVGPLQVDETDTETCSVNIEIPESALKTDPMTALRITMTVRNI